MPKTHLGTVTPHLTVKGVVQAISFYEQAFAARELFRMMADDGVRVLHAQLAIGQGEIMLCDPLPEYGTHGVPPLPGAPASLAVVLTFPEPEAVDRTFARALAAGAMGEMVPTDVVWGDRFAALNDPFGHRWMLSAPQAPSARA